MPRSKTIVDFETECRHKDGSPGTVTWFAHWSNSEGAIIGVAHDITPRKRAERQMKEAKEAAYKAQKASPRN